ncbi:MAG: NAD(P)H-hydrate dehydratase [Candidatus Methanofastidiosia archaeon]
MDFRIIDTNARYFGLSPIVLMENAGRGIADHIRNNIDGKKIAIVCGTGNNGGDGFVIARHLENDFDIDVLLVQAPQKIRTKEAMQNFKVLSHCNVNVISSCYPPKHWNYDLIIDAMLGTGASGVVREPYASFIKSINNADVPAISIDVPSGYRTDLELQADATISLHEKKIENATTLPIGIPHQLTKQCGPGNVKFLHRRNKDAHKRQGGVVAIVGGSETYHGAPAYAGITAAKICDLVYVLCPLRVGDALRSLSPDLIIESQIGPDITMHLAKSPLLSSVDSILCGVGAGRSIETVDALLHIYERATAPLVIDADGLFALKGHLDLLDKNVCITPHAKEYERLFGPLPGTLNERKKHVKSIAEKYGCTIVLKGMVDIISNGDESWQNITGNEGMATGGTGDALAGCIAAFATTNPLLESALAATFAVGLSGDALYAQKKTFFTARDVVEMLPDVLAFCHGY